MMSQFLTAWEAQRLKNVDYSIDSSPVIINAGGGQSKIEVTLIDDDPG